MAWRDHFEPLRVTARLRCGVVADRWLPLDAVLLYQATREQYGAQAMTVAGGHPQQPHGVRMPLAILPRPAGTHDPDWYYACSFAQADWRCEAQDHWNKRFDPSYASLIDFAGQRGAITVRAGEHRAYHMPVYYRLAETITWYCVGDRAEISALLLTCTHLGKKASQGWGRVIEWQVEPWPEDWSVWQGDRLMRAVPAAAAAGRGEFALGTYGLRPAYYRTEHLRQVALPS